MIDWLICGINYGLMCTCIYTLLIATLGPKSELIFAGNIAVCKLGSGKHDYHRSATHQQHNLSRN